MLNHYLARYAIIIFHAKDTEIEMDFTVSQSRTRPQDFHKSVQARMTFVLTGDNKYI